MYLEMSDKVKLYVKQSGEGIPCIFVHGGPGEGSLDFEALGGNSLESFMQMIYFDQRGCARSGGTVSDDYSIERIIVPVLVITGNEDYAIGPNHYRNFMFPNKKVKIIHGKHMVYLENNEEFKSVIREFIE